MHPLSPLVVKMVVRDRSWRVGMLNYVETIEACPRGDAAALRVLFGSKGRG